MQLKRRKCTNISEMFQACGQPLQTPPTASRPPTRGDDTIHTPPPTIGLVDVTPEASPQAFEAPEASPHINEANDATRLASVRSDSIRSSSEPSCFELPTCWVQDGHFMPCDKEHVNKISAIITSGYTGCWPTYTSVPWNTKEQWWAQFQDSLYEARQKWFGDGEKVDWIDKVVMEKLVKYWESDKFKNQSSKNLANRRRATSDGREVAKRDGGSRSTYDTKLFIESEKEREVSNTEVYIYMHTSKTTKLHVDSISSKIQILELTQQVSELTNQNHLLNEKIQKISARDTTRETEMASIRGFMAKYSNGAS